MISKQENIDINPLPAGRLIDLARRYRVRLDVKSAAGVIGLKDGRESGPSVEIQDFRDYVPGDDPRRIDWMAYGRTGKLIVRLFREEVSPFFDIIVDTSSSMALPDGRKHALTRELSSWLFHSARLSTLPVRIYSAGQDIRRLEGPELLAFDQPASIVFADPLRAVTSLRRSAVRLLITDFMEPVEPSLIMRRLAEGCHTLIIIRLLGPWEANPKIEGPAVLEPAEEAREIDIEINEKTLASYKRRLDALAASLREESFRCGATLINIVANKDIESIIRNELFAAGLAEAPG